MLKLANHDGLQANYSRWGVPFVDPIIKTQNMLGFEQDWAVFTLSAANGITMGQFVIPGTRIIVKFPGISRFLEHTCFILECSCGATATATTYCSSIPEHVPAPLVLVLAAGTET